MKLEVILAAQKSFQKSFGVDFDKMTVKEKTDYIKEQSLWVTDELHEMLRELPYVKPWSNKYESWDREKISDQLQFAKEEFIDLFIFVINIGLALDLDEESIYKLYKEKNKINQNRQLNGY